MNVLESRRISPELTVLVVDDRPVHVALRSCALESGLLQVEPQEWDRRPRSVRAGVSRDVVLLDVNMSEMDGLQDFTPAFTIPSRLEGHHVFGIADPRKA